MLKIDGKVCNQKLEEVMTSVFAPSSASSNVAKRSEFARLLAANLPALGSFSVIEIDTDDDLISVRNDNLISVLEGIVKACAENEAYREKVKVYEAQYDSVRQAIAKNPSDGKRGRKAKDIEATYSSAFTLA